MVSSIILGRSVLAGTFSYYSELNGGPVVQYIYPVDINNDGIDEVFFAGFETQPNTPQAYTNTSVHIFGFIGDQFTEITSSWLPGALNKVEGVGDLTFGDFNGDGLKDVFLSGYADMTHSVNVYVLINRGGYFDKVQIDTSDGWQHAVASGDINKDGFDDVLAVGYGTSPTLYLGSARGLEKAQQNVFLAASGVTIGDFLGDGTLCVIVSDHDASNGYDTALYQLNIDTNGNVSATRVSALPTARLDLPEYGPPSNNPLGRSHDVRVKSIDFTNDGLLDVIVFSIMGFDGTKWPEISEVQFLENSGSGIFLDVTDTVLHGYTNTTNVHGYPVIRDFNQDGLTDIYLSASSDWEGNHNSTVLLMQQQNGTFVESYRSALSGLIDDMGGMGGMSTIAKGPHGFYIVSTIVNSDYSQTVQYTEIQNSSLNPLDRPNGSESLRGTPWDDAIYGFEGNDSILPLAGNDYIDGGAGVDTVVFTGPRANYTITRTATGHIVTSTSEGADALANIERLQFSDMKIAIDITDNALKSMQFIGVIAPILESDLSIRGAVLSYFDQGQTMLDACQLALSAGWMPSDNTELVKATYKNVIGTNPDQATINSLLPYVDQLGDAGFLAAVASMNINVDLVGLQQGGLEYA